MFITLDRFLCWQLRDMNTFLFCSLMSRILLDLQTDLKDSSNFARVLYQAEPDNIFILLFLNSLWQFFVFINFLFFL